MGYIGNHVSSSGGFFAMGAHELDLGGDTFAFFTRNPRGGASRAADPEDAAKLMRLLTEHSFGPLVAHAPYTLNACSTNERVAAFAREAMTGDLLKIQLLPGQFYNFHPGSHLGQGPEKAIPQIAAVVNEALAAVPEGRTTVLLETMAGKGSEVGRTFEELRMIMDRIDRPERIGVTLDTCHVWDAGYDIAGNLDGVLKEFDEVIGLEHLKAIHLNDSKNPCGSRKDRHEKLGKGCIGEEALRRVVTHPALASLPFILETPNEDEGYRREIRMVRSWMEE
ncbi:deoxyribonuclease IV [Chordicoccus furentiruminis]|uniref:deoxyribonuclease IV n=1 Tax=Chordicoccus furentiruminis TaxID=2709410 RepID=UPI0023A7E1FD|nr:deoxyribonuclease IV [Chordicoccus furentiruminis]